MKDPNLGKYDEAIDYFWEYAVSGAGNDEFLWGTMVTVFFISPDDIALFPYLKDFTQVALWEDSDTGKVSMLHLKPCATCLLCKDPLQNHEVGRHGIILCDALL